MKRKKHLAAITVRCSEPNSVTLLPPDDVCGIFKPSDDEIAVISDELSAEDSADKLRSAVHSVNIGRGLCSVTVFGDSMLGKEAAADKIVSLLHSAGVRERFISVCETELTLYADEENAGKAWDFLKEQI